MNKLEQMSNDIYEGLGRHLPDMSKGWADIAKQVEDFEDAVRADERKTVLREAADAVSELRKSTITHVARYPRYDMEAQMALSDAESKLRRMAKEGES